MSDETWAKGETLVEFREDGLPKTDGDLLRCLESDIIEFKDDVRARLLDIARRLDAADASSTSPPPAVDPGPKLSAREFARWWLDIGEERCNTRQEREDLLMKIVQERDRATVSR